jgi:hypothetical protein
MEALSPELRQQVMEAFMEERRARMMAGAADMEAAIQYYKTKKADADLRNARFAQRYEAIRTDPAARALLEA